jgi:hypothetical protein
LPLLEAAAAANHPVAQYQLGQFYETGAPPLVPQNLESPVNCMQRQPSAACRMRPRVLPFWDRRPSHPTNGERAASA